MNIVWNPRFSHSKKNEGTCSICEREEVPLVRHHLIPKDPKSPFELVCKPCANQIHVLFTNVELKQIYNTIEKIKSAPRMQKFIRWLRRADPNHIKVRESRKVYGWRRGKKRR